MQKILVVSPKETLNILFLFFPIACLMGNAVININVLLICIIGIIVFRKKIFLFKNERLAAVILIFFILIFFSTLIDISKDPRNDHFFKSISYFRYFFLFLVSSYLVRNGKFKIKYFLISCSVCSLFLSLDIIYQFLNGSDIFGFPGYSEYYEDVSHHYERSPYHLAGFLGQEYVAGGYIQKFFVFALILIPIIWKKLDKQKFLISTALPIIFFSGTLFSGNRMPLVMFCVSILIMMILIKELRFSLVIASLFCVLIFTTTIKMNDNLRISYESFYGNSSFIMSNMKKYVSKKYPELEKRKKEKCIEKKSNDPYCGYFQGNFAKSKKPQSKYVLRSFGSGHLVIYLTAIDVWVDNLIIGNGIKSFRIKCLTKLHLPNRACSTHPHNYYLELLNDTGLLGTLLLVCAVFYLITNKFFNFKYYERNEKFLFICLLIIIIAEFFPLKSSGSFFSTANSSFIFLILGMLNGLKKN